MPFLMQPEASGVGGQVANVTGLLHTIDENNAVDDVQRQHQHRRPERLNRLTPFHHQQQHTPEHQWPPLQGY